MRPLLIAILVLGVSLSVPGCGPEKRPAQSMDQLLAARRADDQARAAEGRELQRGLMARIRSKYDAVATATTARATAGPTTAPMTGATTRPTVDLLVISGGGDWGAFGAGVLKGWGRVRG